MKGIELSRQFYQETINSVFCGVLEPLRQLAAVGLVGEGSECHGWDDELSKDHDFGPDYCIWVPEQVYRSVGAELEKRYASLPEIYCGYKRGNSRLLNQRRGIMTVEGFYQKYTGLTHPPETAMEWLQIPECFLAIATNGTVYEDTYGKFSDWRKVLLQYYPQDVYRKKLASCITRMGQAGQYNYIRCCQREQYDGAYMAGGEFIKATLSAVYLLNRCYQPFYKWSFYGTGSFSRLTDVVQTMKVFIQLPDNAANKEQKIQLIETICSRTAEILRADGLSNTSDNFMVMHGSSIADQIQDGLLRKRPILAD